MYISILKFNSNSQNLKLSLGENVVYHVDALEQLCRDLVDGTGDQTSEEILEDVGEDIR